MPQTKKPCLIAGPDFIDSLAREGLFVALLLTPSGPLPMRQRCLASLGSNPRGILHSHNPTNEKALHDSRALYMADISGRDCCGATHLALRAAACRQRRLASLGSNPRGILHSHNATNEKALHDSRAFSFGIRGGEGGIRRHETFLTKIQSVTYYRRCRLHQGVTPK